MKLTKLFNDFFNSERAGGLLLIICTAISLTLANVLPSYELIWHIDIANHHLVHWINDGLMAVFFLLIGLELEREIYIGELSSIKNASLPIAAAIGGMVVPASIYFLINVNAGDLKGIGIPMATDIAFALAVLSLLGNRIAPSVKVFLAALAVIDDLGAIVVIAAFYTTDISIIHLVVALSIFALLLIFNRMRIHVLWPYLIGGIVMWYFMLNSGVHATVAGVLLAFAIPFGNGDEKSPSYRLQHVLHKPVAFLSSQFFALANTSIVIQNEMFYALTGAVSLGIIAGLLIGKPIGIIVFSFIAQRSGLSSLPEGMKWQHVVGASFLGGIGFTMSIFITLLAFSDQQIIDQSKIAVMGVSIVAGVIGYVVLRLTPKESLQTSEHAQRNG